jgi:hypothetical protein
MVRRTRSASRASGRPQPGVAGPDIAGDDPGSGPAVKPRPSAWPRDAPHPGPLNVEFIVGAGVILGLSDLIHPVFATRPLRSTARSRENGPPAATSHPVHVQVPPPASDCRRSVADAARDDPHPPPPEGLVQSRLVGEETRGPHDRCSGHVG